MKLHLTYSASKVIIESDLASFSAWAKLVLPQVRDLNHAKMMPNRIQDAILIESSPIFGKGSGSPIAKNSCFMPSFYKQTEEKDREVQEVLARLLRSLATSQ
ncbi:hypothetical protein ACJX0J_003699 (mitochondrion) [Zea mays]